MPISWMCKKQTSDILQSYRETCCKSQHSACAIKFQPSTSISIRLMLILTIITRVTSNIIVLWETPHNTVDWDCFRTLILLGILETQNQHQEDSRAHPAATHPPQQVGCARNKHQPHTAQRKLRLPLLMQVYAWMGCQLLIIGIWSLKCSILHQTNQRNPKMEYEETRCETPIKQAHQESNQDSNPARHS